MKALIQIKLGSEYEHCKDRGMFTQVWKIHSMPFSHPMSKRFKLSVLVKVQTNVGEPNLVMMFLLARLSTLKLHPKNDSLLKFSILIIKIVIAPKLAYAIWNEHYNKAQLTLYLHIKFYFLSPNCYVKSYKSLTEYNAIVVLYFYWFYSDSATV